MKRQVNHIAKKGLTVHRQTSAASQRKPISKSLIFNVTRYTINNPCRICFRFEAGHAFDVQIVDYH